MIAAPPDPATSGPRLADVLLGYLLRAWTSLPGADGLTTRDVLDGYAVAVTNGAVPDWAELIGRHPSLHDDLLEWLAAADRWRFVDALLLTREGDFYRSARNR